MTESEIIAELGVLAEKIAPHSEHSRSIQTLYDAGEWGVLLEFIENEANNPVFDQQDRLEIARIRSEIGPTGE